ncbi:MAG: FapA family protein [Syntrophobacteraceae bacterium]
MGHEDGPVVSEPKAYHGEEERLLARLVVKHGLLNQKQISEALSYQHFEWNRGNSISLGDALTEKCLLTHKQLDALNKTTNFLVLRQAAKPFARIAIRNGFAVQDQVDRAMELQATLFKRNGLFKSLGDILVEQGVLSLQQKKAIDWALVRARKESSHRETAGMEIHASKSVSQEEVISNDSSSTMEESPEEDEKGKTLVAKDEYFDLLVSQDKMGAYIQITGDIPDEVDVARIKSLLESNKIVFGLFDDNILEKYLKHRPVQKRLWQVAQGQPPQVGRKAEIRYCFDVNASNESEREHTAGMSLKDMGRIVQVRQGELLAEKIPAIIPFGGTDIYGNTKGIERSADVKLLCGAGAELSSDGLKAFAKTDGIPQVSPLGKLSVLPELNIDGDISFETGNISFEGHINVRGVVQDGFRVQGSSLSAREIAKANVDVTGDVVVYGGILGATIKSQGNVKAVHVHASKIEALGDLIVERDVIDSKVTLSGKFVANRGKIISSSIVARQGIEAKQIGSDRSLPCSLAFGTDPLTEKEIERLKEDISTKLKNKAINQALAVKAEEESAKIELRIGELAQIQDRALRDKRVLSAKLEEQIKLNRPEEISRMETMLKEIESSEKQSEQELEGLFDQQDKLKESITANREKIRELESELESAGDELAALSGWSSDKVRPVVKIFDTIFAGTVVKGLFTSLVMKSDARSVLIKEVKNAAENGSGASSWGNMSVSNL